jgi:hypothetical protein
MGFFNTLDASMQAGPGISTEYACARVVRERLLFGLWEYDELVIS